MLKLFYIKIMKNFILLFLILIFSKFNVLYSKPNDQVIHDALGFMLGGDYGWDGVAVDYQIDGCLITYVQDLMGNDVIVIYDFEKALWNSASSQIGEDGREYFFLDGKSGLQEVYMYGPDGEDLSDGLWIYGIQAGKGTLMTFPIVVDISRFENAMYDLMDECPGVKSKY